MIPFLEEIARTQADIDGDEFLQIVGIAQTFPGAMGINTAVIIGFRMGGFKGAIASLLGVTVPSVICATGLFYFLLILQGVFWIEAAMTALKAAIVGIILAMAIHLGRRSWHGSFGWMAIAVLAMLCFYQFQLNPVFILLGTGIIGLLAFSGGGWKL